MSSDSVNAEASLEDGAGSGKWAFMFALAALCTLAVWLIGSNEDGGKARAVREPAPAERIALNPSMQTFLQVQPGMSIVEVENIFEKRGELASAAGSLEIYTWTNAEGGVVSVTFDSRRMAAKSQVGLK